MASLRNLNEATEGYAASEKRLREAGGRLEDLANATRDTGEKIVDGVQAMRSLSGPEILGEVRNTQGMLKEQNAAVVVELTRRPPHSLI